MILDNTYLSDSERDFFILLRVGLWQKADGIISENPDWGAIFELACQQTVQGLLADGIGLYLSTHPEVKCPIFEDFLNHTAQIVRQNYGVNQVQAQLCGLLSGADVDYVILKGQGVAQCYPKPMLRCSGDIDVLLPPESYERAKKLLDSEGKFQASENRVDLHYGIEIDGIEVELHGMANTESGGNLDRVLDRERDLLFRNCQFDSATINDVACPLPNATYHAMYLFFHCIRHYMGTGLGIRQICDIAMFLHSHSQQIDWAHLYGVIRETRVEREWNQFYSFCVCYLGMPETLECLNRPVDVSSRDVLKLWIHAKTYGNFGHNQESLLSGHPNRFIHIGRILRYHLGSFVRVVRFNPRVAVSRFFRLFRFMD